MKPEVERVASGGGALVLFPGMAAAFPGMARPLAEAPAADAVFRRFAAASGVDVGAAARELPEDALLRDRTWELAVVATEAAAFAAWQAEGNTAGAALGFSIGAYAALMSAGALEVEAVTALVDAVLEESLRLPGRYAMLAVSGIALEAVRPHCRAGGVELAAVIAPTQLLFAGTESAVAGLAAAVASLALSVRPLPVRWPLHTSLMGPVSAALESRRGRFAGLRPFRHPVYSALHGGRIATPEEGWRLLVDHLCKPQRFDLAFAAARADGLGRCVELGPGGSLKRAVGWLERGAVEVATYPEAPPRRRQGSGR